MIYTVMFCECIMTLIFNLIYILTVYIDGTVEA